MKRIVAFLGAFVVVAFAVFVVRETAAVVALARDVDPRLGQATLWTLIAIYAACLAVPAVLFMRLPKPLDPPPTETDPRFQAYLVQLSKRLGRNRRLPTTTVTPDRASVQAALTRLDTIADQEIRKEASLVFVSTAISQSGRLDALFVLIVQTRLIWKVAHIYRQRASAREMVNLYAAVAATVFAAESVEDLDLAEVAEPLAVPLLEAATVSATTAGLLAPVASMLADALLQGTVNSLLTFRVGCIAKRYSSGLPLPDRKAVRRSATREAAVMLGGVAVELSKTVTRAVWNSTARVVTDKGKAAVYEALKKMAGRKGADSHSSP